MHIDLTESRISEIEVRPGYLHRGAEKLFEVRDYRSLIMLADRHDWLSSFSGELVVTLAVEGAMRLVPPPRATRLRTLLAEYVRVHSHLSYLSYVLRDDTNSERLWGVVDQLREGLLAWTGNRVHPMLCRIGGLAADAPAGWLDHLPAVLDDVERVADDVAGALASSGRFRGIGIADEATCHQYGLSGPVARAAGFDVDVRATGLLDYAEFFHPAGVRTNGDTQARFEVLADEVRASAAMIRSLALDVPTGEFSTRLSRRLKVPEGEHTAEVEAPWGIAGVFLVSRGGPTPWRLALRTPTFACVSALEQVALGSTLEQLPDVVASMGYAIGDLDK